MRKGRMRAIGVGAALAALLIHAPAQAACTVTTVSVAFGAYDPTTGTADDSVGSATAQCKRNDPAPNIALSTGGSGTYSPRRMTGGVWTLNYNLYTNVARTIVFGDGTGGTATVNPPGVNVPGNTDYTATIYGRIPALQNVGAGGYTDTITVTVTW